MLKREFAMDSSFVSFGSSLSRAASRVTAYVRAYAPGGLVYNDKRHLFAYIHLAPGHTRFLPHPRMDAASRFCSFNDIFVSPSALRELRLEPVPCEPIHVHLQGSYPIVLC